MIHESLTDEDAANDLCRCVEVILKRPLTAEESAPLKIKARFWFIAGVNKALKRIGRDFTHR